MESHLEKDPIAPTLGELKLSKAYPISDLKIFKEFIGFYNIIEELNENKVFDSEKQQIEYCNWLLFYIGILNNNHEQREWLPAIIREDIIEKELQVHYGSMIYSHLLKMIIDYSHHKWGNDEYNDYFIDYFYELFPYYKTQVIQNVKFNFFLFTDEFPPIDFILIEPNEINESRFFIHANSFLERNYPDKYEPIKFFRIIKEYIQFALEIGISDPMVYRKALLTKREGSTEVENEIETKGVLYWVLIAIKYRIFFIDWNLGPLNPNFNKTEFDLLYEFLNCKAIELNCSPENDPLAPVFSIIDQSYQKNNDSGDNIKPTFGDYLSNEGREFLPILNKIYTSPGKKNRFAYMLFALKDLGLLTEDPIIKQQEFHQALVNSYGEGLVGVKANLQKYLSALARASSSEQAQIEREKRKIKEEFEKGNLLVS